MHPEISKLIEIAKSSNRVTERQKEIIKNKAKTLGEDLDEVEMILETIVNKSLNDDQSQNSQKKKCPNCGAVISDNFLTCPECGYVFKDESNNSAEARRFIEELSEQLKEVDARFEKKSEDPDCRGDALNALMKQKDMIKASIITTFVVPTTKEHLILLFSYAYSNYLSTKDIQDSILAPAWLGRAKNAYLLLKSQPVIDAQTKELLTNYSFIDNITHKQKYSFENSPLFYVLLFIIIIVIFIVAGFSS